MTQQLKPRKVFSVVIYDKEFDVYNIEGKEHSGLNNTIKTWWIYFSDRLPENMIPPHDSENWEPYCVGILRQVWEIKITQRNTTKEKWNATQFNNNIQVEMWCNKKIIYAFGTSGKYLDYAMAKVQYLQVQMAEHCYNFFEPEKESGRKIYWYNLPATIKPMQSEPWNISIYPDYTEGLNKEEWWEEYRNRSEKTPVVKDEDWEDDTEDREESMRDDCIRWGDALSDGHINWFRN